MLNKNLLVNLLKGMVNGNLSISGDTDIKVLSDVVVREQGTSIFIYGTGLNEYEEEIKDSFSLNLNTIKSINMDLDTIELHTQDSKLLLLEAF